MTNDDRWGRSAFSVSEVEASEQVQDEISIGSYTKKVHKNVQIEMCTKNFGIYWGIILANGVI